MTRWPGLALALGLLAPGAQAATVTVLSAGAFRPVVLALAPAFRQETGDTLVVEGDTAGALQRRIAAGEAFDLAILPPATIAQLAAAGRVAAGGGRVLGRTGVGVVVAAGAPRPDVSTPEALRRTLLAARSIAYIDPRSGGSSGTFVQRLLQRLGIAGRVRDRTVLVEGGRVADHVARGEAELGLHQVSEIVPVAGAILAGPLPAALQGYTDYAAVRAPGAGAGGVAVLLDLLAGAQARAAMTQVGLEPAP